MKRPLQVFALGMLLVALPAAAGQQEAPEEPTFRVDVQLVNLIVTVEDSQGAPIGDLERDDFGISDGGVPREVAVFERRTNRPLSVALMIDASLSTAIELSFERKSAKRFLENLLGAGSQPRDRVAILKFSDYVEMLTKFTKSQKQLAGALQEVRPESGTSMYDAIFLCARQLGRRAGRRVMVIITDGGDTTSNSSFQQALEAAHGVDAVIYGMIVMPIKSDAGRNIGGEHALKTLAANTGGRAFVQLGEENLDQAFTEILQSLRTQYLIGYYPPDASTATRPFRPVSVTVNRPDAEVLARNGYYVPVTKRTPQPGRISIQPKKRASGRPQGEVFTPSSNGKSQP